MSEQAFSSKRDHDAAGLSAGSSAASLGADDLEAVRRLRDAFDSIKQQLARIIVGQDQVIEELLIACSAAATAFWKACPAWPRH